MVNRAWEAAVNADFIEKVGKVIAHWHADHVLSGTAMDELAGLYESMIDELPTLDEEEE